MKCKCLEKIITKFKDKFNKSENSNNSADEIQIEESPIIEESDQINEIQIEEPNIIETENSNSVIETSVEIIKEPVIIKKTCLNDYFYCASSIDVPRNYIRLKDYNPNWYFCGYDPCNYIRADLYNVITIVAASIRHDFPDRQDVRLSIGDGCPYPWTVQVASHPQHSGGWVIDFNYYTFGENNITQYIPPWLNRTSPVWYKNATPLWKDPENASGVIKANFDTERNWTFCNRILDLMPHSTIIVYKTFFQMFSNECLKTPDDTQRLHTNFISDNLKSLYHQTHMHITFGSGDIAGGRDIMWDKPFDWIPQTID